ncbi:hypothetical protein RIF29_23886 [Crotalaria pallida]|uniref:Uncharacterized protein n=1 Tax=Crotalaria pallida TaxID=3830 RepID=A0AAN9EJB4_CROPI
MNVTYSLLAWLVVVCKVHPPFIVSLFYLLVFVLVPSFRCIALHSFIDCNLIVRINGVGVGACIALS